MGADIHIIVERRYNDRWVGIHACGGADQVSHSLYPNDGKSYDEMPKLWGAYWKCEGRNYNLFAALAGVRGEGPEPNGIPDDVSDLAEMMIDSWGTDGHSHCHYTLRECGVRFMTEYAPEKLLDEQRYGWLCSFFGFINSFVDEADLLDNTRLIIFFDN